MYKLLIILLFGLFNYANANEIIDLNKQMKCSDAQSVMNYFLDKHKETPVWVGKTVHGSYITLLSNKETRSWTLVEYDSRMACVLGAGEDNTSSDISI